VGGLFYLERKYMEQETKSIDRLRAAYRILEGQVYIPDKYRPGFAKFLKKVCKENGKLPFHVMTMDLKLEIDNTLDDLAVKIYRKLKLKNYTE
jgi:phosphoglycolate phosphatase-like HAD superfamily hydrolase